MKKIKTASCALTIGIMVLIFFLSSQSADKSSELSRGLTYRIAEIITAVSHAPKSGTAELAKSIHNVIRKCAHFSEYALLGLSSLASVRLVSGKPILRSAVCAVLICVLYAATDEVHQYFVPGRSMRAFDVFIDTCGALTGALAGTAIFRAGRRAKDKRRNVG